MHSDLNTILEFAIDEDLLDGKNPAARLITPREAVHPHRRKLDKDQVVRYLMVLELREKLIASLVLFSGLRPGEVFPLKLGDHHGAHFEIARRIYRGSLGAPKNHRSERPVGLAPGALAMLQQWKERLLDTRPGAWLFPSENPGMPLRKDNCWRRNMLPRLETVGLEWANFHVLRRTYASQSNDCGIDPKLTADQMGHSVDVNANVYTQTYIDRMIEAATRLEERVLGRSSTAVVGGKTGRSEA